jgi:hypothetical protein
VLVLVLDVVLGLVLALDVVLGERLDAYRLALQRRA